MKDKIFREKLFNLFQKIYYLEISKDITIFGKGINEAEFAKRNRLLHFLFLEYSQLFKNDKTWKNDCISLISEYNNYKEKVKNSVRRIGQVLEGKEFMIIKTFSSFPHLTNDVDVLVKDWVDEKYPIHIKEKSLWPIQIENKISWLGAEAVSRDFAWNNTQRFSFEELEFLVPNPQLDTIIRVAHMPFEMAHIKLGELLHIYNQALSFDWEVLENEAKLMGWPRTFKKMSNVLEILHQTLFKTSFLGKSMTKSTLSIHNIEFPFQLPYWLLAGAVIEKRAWRKIYGGRYIIKERFLRWLEKNIH